MFRSDGSPGKHLASPIARGPSRAVIWWSGSTSRYESGSIALFALLLELAGFLVRLWLPMMLRFIRCSNGAWWRWWLSHCVLGSAA
jgi:hypothetical protein